VEEMEDPVRPAATEIELEVNFASAAVTEVTPAIGETSGAVEEKEDPVRPAATASAAGERPSYADAVARYLEGDPHTDPDLKMAILLEAARVESKYIGGGGV
jgi:hypothetical protein